MKKAQLSLGGTIIFLGKVRQKNTRTKSSPKKYNKMVKEKIPKIVEPANTYVDLK